MLYYYYSFIIFLKELIAIAGKYIDEQILMNLMKHHAFFVLHNSLLTCSMLSKNYFVVIINKIIIHFNYVNT